MKNLSERLKRIEQLLPEQCPATADQYTDEEKAEIADVLDQIHGSEWIYKNNRWRNVYLTPEGLICFKNGEVFDETTGEVFCTLVEARRKRPQLPIVPVSAELAERLFALKK